MKTDRDRHGSPEGRVPQNRPRGSLFFRAPVGARLILFFALLSVSASRLIFFDDLQLQVIEIYLIDKAVLIEAHFRVPLEFPDVCIQPQGLA